jgi:ATP/maltotriose-dependent transcriptional regulator MalT
MTRLPTVQANTLLIDPPLSVGTDSWFAWLRDARSFAYRGAGGRFTARQEERSGRRFWYAYRQQHGVLRKTYLGRSSELTIERLDEAARALAQVAEVGQNSEPDGAGKLEAAQKAGANGSAPDTHAADGWLSPLIATKIAMPQSAQTLVARTNVLAQCVADLDHPCTLVAAPAGFGKTTMLLMAGEEVQRQGWRVAWVTLEESEQDPTRFWQYVLAALDSAQPGVSGAARHLLEFPRPAMTERMLTVLINELSAAHTPLLLVLDDYHRAETPAIDQGIIFLIEHAPATLHLLLAARSTPALPLARLHAQGRIAELDATDLRFTPDEAGRFMRETMRVSLRPEQLAQLEARTEGWVAGLQLAALSLRNQTDFPELAAATTPHYIAEYLIDEVLERQPEDIQLFLLQTAPLERLSGSLCDAVTGRNDSAVVLARLMQEQLFVTPLDATQTWYRYHHLFAEVLRERLGRRMPAQVNECHRRAAAWLWAHGLADDSIRHLLAAECYAEAADQIEQQSDRLVQHGELAGLARWVRALPREVTLAHPHLSLLNALALLLQGEAPDAIVWLETLEKREAESGSLRRAIPGELAAVRSFLTLWSGDVYGGARIAQEALRTLPPDDLLLRGLTLWIANVIGVFGEGNIAEAARIIGELAETSRRSGNMLVAFMALVTKAGAQLYLCELHGSEHTCEETLRLLPGEGEQESPMAAMAYCIQGEIRREWNDLDAAETILRRALAIGDTLGSPEFINDGLLYLALVQMGRGQFGEALATLERIRSMVQAGQLAPWDLAQMEIMRARVLVARGALDEAQRWADECLRRRHAPEPGATGMLVFVCDLEDLAIARISLARRDAPAAIAALETLRPRAEATEQWRNLMEARILLALAYAQTGKSDAALGEIHAALTIAAPEGFVRVFLDEGSAMADLLERYLASHHAPSPEVAHAGRVLAAFGRAFAAGDISSGPLSAREIDVLRLLAAGRPNEAIARELVLALSTVKWHVAHIYRKLGVRGRVQAITRGRELRLIA